MKKIAILMANLLLLSSVAAYAEEQKEAEKKDQEVTKSASFKMTPLSGPDGTNIKAFTRTYQYSKDDVLGGIVARLNKESLKGKKVKNNFFAFKGVRYNHLWPRTFDFYIAVNGSSAAATLYLVMSTGYDNFILDGDENQDKVISDWMDSLDQSIKEYIHGNKIADQEKVVATADKDVDKLKKEKTKIEKNIVKNEAAIKEFEATRLIPDAYNVDNIDTKRLQKEQKMASKLADQQKKLQYELEDIDKKIDKANDKYSEERETLKKLKSSQP